MTALRPRSLQLRLAVPLAALFILGSAAIVGVLVWRAYDTAGTLADRELSLRAADLAQYVAAAPDGTPRLALPAALREPTARRRTPTFSPSAPATVVSSPPCPRPSAPWSGAGRDHRRSKLFPSAGMAGRTRIIMASASASTARPAHCRSGWRARQARTHWSIRCFEEFVLDIAWVIPLFMLLALGVAILAIRSTLRPIREVSEIAASIGPGTTSVRLPAGKPAERDRAPGPRGESRARPARARLRRAASVHRQRRARIAHAARHRHRRARKHGAECRGRATQGRRRPHEPPGRAAPERRPAGRDRARCLGHGRPERRRPGHVSPPWRRGRSRKADPGLRRCRSPRRRQRQRLRHRRCLRNLVENAVAHAPPRSEVTVSARTEGSIDVSRPRAGRARRTRERIFERFWRGKAAPSHGAGLGLAIVAEIMKAHGGSVRSDAGRTAARSSRSSFRRHRSRLTQRPSRKSGRPSDDSVRAVKWRMSRDAADTHLAHDRRSHIRMFGKAWQWLTARSGRQQGRCGSSSIAIRWVSVFLATDRDARQTARHGNPDLPRGQQPGLQRLQDRGRRDRRHARHRDAHWCARRQFTQVCARQSSPAAAAHNSIAPLPDQRAIPFER